MQANTLHVSIDLESEIRKITRRQYLNDVHYLVQLVRHALLHDPRSIRIWSSPRWLEMHQDGEPFTPTEWQLLTRLLVEKDVSDETKQRALNQLEEHHGITVLSILLIFPRVSVTTRAMRLMSSGSRIEMVKGHEYDDGYRIRIRRNRGSRRQERRELEYFCSGVEIPVYYNNTSNNKALELEGQILTLRGEHTGGTGAVGIPYSGDVCTFEYFKKGVRIGMKHYLPHDGRVFHGFWDSSESTFEPHYAETVAHGDGFFDDHSRRLYELVGHHFETLDAEQKSRIKALLMGFEEAIWRRLWEDLPLFSSSFEPFVLSLRALLRLKERFGAVPCVVTPNRSAPEYVPYLTTEDIWFLRHTLNLPLRLYMGRRRSPRFRFGFLRRKVSPTIPTDCDELKADAVVPEAAGSFLSALNEDGYWLKFNVTSASSCVVDTREGQTVVYLRIDSPEFKQALGTFEQNPDQLPLLRHLLVDVARQAMRRQPRTLRP